jgi:hypothetical protein
MLQVTTSRNIIIIHHLYSSILVQWSVETGTELHARHISFSSIYVCIVKIHQLYIILYSSVISSELKQYHKQELKKHYRVVFTFSI